MSPEDEMLWRTVLYVGLGIGVLCMAAALAIQVWMLRKGKATRKDVRDLVTGFLLFAPLAALAILAILAPGYEPSRSVSATVDSLFVALFTSMIISRLPEAINRGTEAVGALAHGGDWREVIWLARIPAVITVAAYAIAHFMPASWTLRATALFVGCVAGLIWRWVLLTRASLPQEPPEAESLIIKAGS